MRRVAIVEYMMSAGGVERVLRGLAQAFLEIPEARDFEISFLLSRYNSAGRRCEWPPQLTGPQLRVEWLGETSPLSRFLDPYAQGRAIAGIARTKVPALLSTQLLRRLGPTAWREFSGDRNALIARASERFDLMYFHFPFGMTAPRMRCAVVTTPADFNYKHFLPSTSRGYRSSERYMHAWLARSDRVLMSSRAMLDELRQFYPQYSDKAEVVHLGITQGSAPPAADEVASFVRAKNLPDRFFVTPGWVLAHKNQLVLIEATRRLRARGISAPIVFVGPNAAQIAQDSAAGVKYPYVDDVRSALSAAGSVAGRDHFVLGYVSDAELRCLFHAATAVVVPSTYEGFGLPGLEAMLAGTPTLLSQIPPFLEQNEALGGVLRMFDPHDASGLAELIEWILGHPSEAREVARVAAERVARAYDWRKTAREYLAAFAATIDRREARAARRA